MTAPFDWLEYRLNELHDEGQRRHLFRDLAEVYPALRAFLGAVDDALRLGDADLQEEVKSLKEELDGVREDLAVQEAAADDLRSDMEYWRKKYHEAAGETA